MIKKMKGYFQFYKNFQYSLENSKVDFGVVYIKIVKKYTV